MLPTLFLALLLGCGPEAAAPVQTAIAPPEAPAGTQEGERTDFSRAFAARAVRLPHGDAELVVRSLGALTIADDEALWAGAASAPEALPITVATGTYPVEVSVVDGVAAALRVQLGATPAARWVYLGSFASDGHAVLCGETAAKALGSGPGREIEVKAQAGMDRWFLHKTGEADDVVVCATGHGDGAYDAYAGLDDQGEVVEVVLDFAVLVRPVEASHDLGDVLALGEQALDVPGLSERGIKIARIHSEDAALTLDFAAVIADPTIGGYEVDWFDADGQPLYGRSQGFGSRMTFSPPRGARPVRAALRWIARIEPL